MKWHYSSLISLAINSPKTLEIFTSFAVSEPSYGAVSAIDCDLVNVATFDTYVEPRAVYCGLTPKQTAPHRTPPC